MTGFGTASVAVSGGRLVAEVRSVNARFLDLKISLPREHAALEGEVREAVQKANERGRVELSVRREGTARRRSRIEVDLDAARAHADAWRKVQRALGLEGGVDLALLRSSGADIVRVVDAPIEPGDEQPALLRVVAKALAAHARERAREGAHLRDDMRKRLDAIDGLRADCLREAGGLRTVLAERLSSRVAALLGGQSPDPARIVQEVAIAIERSDFTEELTRLGSHLDAFRKLLRDTASVGKRIEFLLQEMLREVNTIGSKAGHLPVTEAVLAAKSELEKVREQAANVE
ncbi:MAG: YicC/YloC family endoribonuclease [Alphaproteobacteria bacterium]